MKPRSLRLRFECSHAWLFDLMIWATLPLQIEHVHRSAPALLTCLDFLRASSFCSGSAETSDEIRVRACSRAMFFSASRLSASSPRERACSKARWLADNAGSPIGHYSRTKTRDEELQHVATWQTTTIQCRLVRTPQVGMKNAVSTPSCNMGYLQPALHTLRPQLVLGGQRPRRRIAPSAPSPHTGL
jgi:hypothetical protein